MSKPQIILRNTVELERLYHNPRYIKDEDFNSLCSSIESNPEHLHARPLILSDRTGILTVIAGNMRLRACIALGIKQVPTILLSGLTEEKEREIIIRDNVNNGNWDYELLANEWDKDLLIDWGVPALWDLDESAESEKEEPLSSSLPDCKLTIEFTSNEQLLEAKIKLQELLKSYPGSELKS